MKIVGDPDRACVAWLFTRLHVERRIAGPLSRIDVPGHRRGANRVIDWMRHHSHHARRTDCSDLNDYEPWTFDYSKWVPV